MECPSILDALRQRFAAALSELGLADPAAYLAQIHVSQRPEVADYQADCAMALGKMLKRPPREVAAELIAKVRLGDLCLAPGEPAGPGFINLRLRDDWMAARLNELVGDPRLGVPLASPPRTFVIDYSAPNVAKPMHVGHIRSTVIGDALYHTLKFLGHTVIGDNHVGDWGTQFGMIIYGYRHFLDREAYERSRVEELARLYRLVNRLVEYHQGRQRLPDLEARVARAEQALAAPIDPADKAAAKQRARQTAAAEELRQELHALREALRAVEHDPQLAELARRHEGVAQAVLDETARLHAGHPANRALWEELLPPCLDELHAVYRRLGVTFDEQLGESFYHDRLGAVVDDLTRRGIAVETEGAIGVFNEGFDAPFLVRKKDGAYLYATSDLATIRYRLDRWRPDVILYVVDHRQSLHFEQLFATARRWLGEESAVDLRHISFGTILGSDGKPYKTRSGRTVGLAGLLDEAVEAARAALHDDTRPVDAPDDPVEQERIAEAIGLAALKYADLSQNRTSDYVFSHEKMLAMNGNTAAYMQYAYARVRSIFARGEVDLEALRRSGARITLGHPAERALGLELLRFPEALDAMLADYRPNLLTSYLFELGNRYSTFFEGCPVLKAEEPELRASRLLLCDLTARVLKQGLALLGIAVVEKM